MASTALLEKEVEEQRMVLDNAIDSFGDAVEAFYQTRKTFPKDSAEYKLAKRLWYSWQHYLSSP